MLNYTKNDFKRVNTKIKEYKLENNKIFVSKYKSLKKMYKIYNYLYKPTKSLKYKALKWYAYDIFNGKWQKKHLWGVYSFCALPGEGKTISMVMHIERQLLINPKIEIYTNFGYKRETAPLLHWTDIVKYTLACRARGGTCIIAFDEMHLTFSCNDRLFPVALDTILSFDRKLHVQFLASSQIYDRLHKRVRDLTNYVVLCKNVMKLDRHFVNYYFDKNEYEAQFSGKKRDATFIREFVCTDYDFRLYETEKLIHQLVSVNEQDKIKEALNLLFNSSYVDSEVPNE